ncbi:MAG: hypothetical protein KIT11_05425 [Fimbriimonadaceae bacterium]|nr:hypothetical protein [Fimbriimonadaceae bacterium]QYK56667.1 MAG: hypothetical protein KF733_04095 [Fimbriimonadaceae bacterium]
MAFTYDSVNIGAEGRDYARFLLGDVDSTTHLLEDEEVEALLALRGFREGVAQLAESCVARVSQQPERFEDEAGIQSEWTQQRVRHWTELAARMRANVTKTTATSLGPDVVSGEMAPTAGLDRLGI